MDSHIQQKPDTTVSEGGAQRAKAARDRVLERRRRFLTGGLSAVPVVITTLANRPALAANFCTVSAVLSGNASRAITGPCGSSPGCWKNHALSNNASSWTAAGFSPGQSFTSVFPQLNSAPWKCYPSNATMLDAISGGVIIKVKLRATDDPNYSVWLDNLAAGFPLQICAGVLNAGFFGTPAYPYTVQGIKTLVTNITTLPTTGKKGNLNSVASNIKNAVSALTSDLNSKNTVTDDCPVV
jgi:hypothetical protein